MAGGMTKEQFYMMAEQMGWTDIKEDEVPIEFGDLDEDSQTALMLYNVLPDIIEGMNGIWIGKNFSGLDAILDIYEVNNRREVFDLLQICIDEARSSYSEKNKQKETLRANRRK